MSRSRTPQSPFLNQAASWYIHKHLFEESSILSAVELLFLVAVERWESLRRGVLPSILTRPLTAEKNEHLITCTGKFWTKNKLFLTFIPKYPSNVKIWSWEFYHHFSVLAPTYPPNITMFVILGSWFIFKADEGVWWIPTIRISILF